MAADQLWALATTRAERAVIRALIFSADITTIAGARMFLQSGAKVRQIGRKSRCLLAQMLEQPAAAICTVCGEPILVGEFPCIVTPRPHAKGMYAAIGDECDITQEMGPRHPIRFRSKQERKRWLKANGFQERACNVGPLDKHCARWDVAMDPQTLDNARVLVSRPGALKGNDALLLPTMRIMGVRGALDGKGRVDWQRVQMLRGRAARG